MGERYSDFMEKITSDEIYDGMIQYGMFSEKLPPIFDAEQFLQYCKKIDRKNFSTKSYNYISYESMRNINIPRSIGIPTPMAHELLCCCLKTNWQQIQEHFFNTTKDQTHIVSRVHIRKIRKTKALFEMNYSNWKEDGTPELDISIGKRYLVKADISQCYSSIYSHAIPWALISKEKAKANRVKKKWFNQIDEAVRNTKNGETHGILIGPHTSNVVSEIVLCSIDKLLCGKKWQYIRNIDDFSCYVNSMDEADSFLVDLNGTLNEYGLSLNHKKTEIIALPIGTVEHWVHQIKSRSVYMEKFRSYVDYSEVQTYLDYCIELMAHNKDNASVLLYGIKVLQDHKLTINAQIYVTKVIVSLSLIYPYIVPLLDEHIFIPYKTNKNEIKSYVNLIYERYLPKEYFEAVSFALYLAAKYEVKIENFKEAEITSSKDCILKLCGLIYCRKNLFKNPLNAFEKHAEKLKDNEMEEYWLFVYECLQSDSLSKEWKDLKDNKISFLKKEFR